MKPTAIENHVHCKILNYREALVTHMGQYCTVTNVKNHNIMHFVVSF